MSYYSSKGSQIVQAAAGLGAMPRRRRPRLPPQAAAGIGRSAWSLQGLGADQTSIAVPTPVKPDSAPAAVIVQANAAETPALVGGGSMSEYDCMISFYQADMDPKYAGLSPEERVRAIWNDYSACRLQAEQHPNVVIDDGAPLPFGVSTRSYRDGVFAIGPAMDAFGRSLQPYRDGIFAGALAGDADAVLDLSDAQVMRQFKMALRALMQSLPAEEIDNPAWDDTTEMQWRSFVAMSAAMPNANVTGWNQKVGGRDFPTALGASAMINAAVMAQGANGVAYATTYWPALSTFQNAMQASGGAGTVVAPGAGLSTADMLALGGGVALGVGIMWLIFGRKR